MKRNVAPDSPQSIDSFEPLRVFAPSIVQQPSEVFTFAPKAVMPRSVASVSSDNRGLETLETPQESAAAIAILWVYDLEEGAQICPLRIRACLIVTVVVMLSPLLFRGSILSARFRLHSFSMHLLPNQLYPLKPQR
jgi:hypothetical protein